MDDTKVAFTVDARLVAQLGEQLVPSDLMALAEIVKNSHDADATTVLIEYHAGEQPYLVIHDDGSGMTIDQLRDGWMVIGAAAKERTARSPTYHRPYAGRKGVGRFAAQRLGAVLGLKTKARNAVEKLEVVFEWARFVPGAALQAIDHVVSLQPEKADAHFTTLTISQLRRAWSKDDLRDVLVEVVGVYKRAPDANDPGFDVVASYHGEQLAIIDEADLLRQERVASLTGAVDTDGNGTYRLEIYKPEHAVVEDRYPERVCAGPLSFAIDLFLLTSDYVSEIPVRKAQELGRRLGGVRILRDGFRLHPYGDPGDDWLKLDEHASARRPPLNMWRNQGTLGAVNITREGNPDFIDLLTRHGLVDAQAFRDMRAFVFHGLEIAAREHGALTLKETRATPGRLRPSEELRKRLEAARSRTKANRDASAERGESDVEELVHAVEEAERPLLDKLTLLRVLASLGTGISTFAHELRTVMQPIGVATQRLDALLGRIDEPTRASVAAQIEALKDGVTSVGVYRRYIDEFMRAGSLARRAAIEVGPVLASAVETLKGVLDRRQIAVRVDAPRGLFTGPMLLAELHSVLFNLLTNAVKALVAPGVTERRLLLSARTEQGRIEMTVADSGCGIPTSIRDRVFDPFVSRAHVPEEEEHLGAGTGLGLAIVRDVVADNGGTVDLVEPLAGYVTAFRVTLRQVEAPHV